MDNVSMTKIKSIVTKIIFAICILTIWELAARMKLFGTTSELVFPSIERIGCAFVNNFSVGYAGDSILYYIMNSLKLLAEGLFIGVLAAFVMSALSIVSSTVYDIYNLLVSIFDLLPGVALLPVVIVVFGVTPEVIVFLVVHAVIWPMSRSILDGFRSVPQIYVEAGMNIGLKGISLITGVYFPASISFIVSGLKTGWARAWRGLISAEMIFGVASCPGIGLYINQMRMNMKNAEMYATLIVIILIGVFVQYGILEPIEKNTVKKWGMSR